MEYADPAPPSTATTRPRWFERKFTFDAPLWMAANVVERLRGTPARLEEQLRALPVSTLTKKPAGKWSIQEHAGHLADLEPLWWERLEQLIAGRPEMAAADLENRRTHNARHNERALDDVLAEFRAARRRLVARLNAATETEWARSASHPRLRVPMRLIDLAFFVAEHDDH